MNIEEVHKIVRKIKTNLFKNSSSYAVGMLRTQFKGAGLRFKEHQIYVHGDDVRFIDWKVLAKTSVPYIKIFEEERNTEIVVIVDASPTMLTGFRGISKLQAALEICCLLYLLSKETGDRVHAILIVDEIFDIPPSSGEKGITRFISRLHSKGILNKDGKINIAYEYAWELSEKVKMTTMMRYLKKRREAIILSDFNEFVGWNLLEKILYRSNIHAFRLESSLDRANRLPWSLYSRKKPSSRDAWQTGVNSNLKGQAKEIEKKRIKILKMEDRYLENFVKNIL